MPYKDLGLACFLCTSFDELYIYFLMTRYDRRIIIQLPHDTPPDSPLLDVMDVRLPSVTRDPVTTFQRLMALRGSRDHKGLFVNH